MSKRNTTIEQYVTKFWSYVDKKGPDECWPWTKAIMTGGYGAFGLGTEDGLTHKTHRLAWEFTNGPIPEGLCACHRCDNPPCCNPAHLFLATNQENTADKMAKGREARGEKLSIATRAKALRGVAVNTAKLDEQKVIEIRRLHAAGMRYHQIAKQFGLDRHTPIAIIKRTSWAHVP